MRHDAEERRVEQERRKQEEVEAQCRKLRLESMLTPVAALSPELPQSKGKGPELAPESEGVQESLRCDSCEKWDAECVWIKVSILGHQEKDFADNLADRPFPFLPPVPGTEDPVLHRRWSSSPAEEGVGGGGLPRGSFRKG